MKKYVKTSIDNQALSVIKEEIEDYVKNYYGALGYESGEYEWPDCVISKQESVNGKDVYKISIEFFAIDEYDIEEICDELDVLAGINGLPVKMYKEFSWDGEYKFTGYIIER